MPRPDASKRAPDEEEYPHWNRVYATVVVLTIAVIFGIWAFSRAFE